nr:DUF2797 domain-containing protein [Streptantibioticus parmotrematis]
MRASADRRCVGVWRAGRRLPCPTAVELAPAARTPQCPSCTAVDRSRSIAADTAMDDPRPFLVYLAHHGTAGIKVGITAEERGAVRLLEQGALSSLVVSAGTLASARRTEHLLHAALGLPDRITTSRKRTARRDPGTPGQRADELTATAESAHALAWPEAQERRQAQPVDHTPTYGLPDGGVRPDIEVTALAAGCVISGRIACRIGTDLYLHTSAGLLLLDTRQLTGWALAPAPPGAPVTAPVAAVNHPETTQDALF